MKKLNHPNLPSPASDPQAAIWVPFQLGSSSWDVGSHLGLPGELSQTVVGSMAAAVITLMTSSER